MKMFLFILCILLSFIQLPLEAEDNTKNDDSRNIGDKLIGYKELTDSKYLLSDILIIKESGERIKGRFLGLIKNEFHLFTGGAINILNLNEIKEFTIYFENSLSGAAISGFFAGGYIAGIFSVNASAGSTSDWHYIKDDYGLHLAMITGIGTISALGLYSILNSDRKRKFKIKEILESEPYVLDELRKEIMGDFISNRINIKAGFGNVASRLENFEGKGIETIDYIRRSRPDFNFLRSVNISYSILYDLDLGVYYYLLNEPDITFSNDSTHPDFYFPLRFENDAYFITGAYHPFKNEIPSCIDFNIGIGLGFSNINLYEPPDIYEDEILEEKSEARFSSLLFCDLGIRLTNSLTFGLSSEIIIIPGSIGLPNFEVHDLPDKEISLNSYFWGFYLKFGFFDYLKHLKNTIIPTTRIFSPVFSIFFR